MKKQGLGLLVFSVVTLVVIVAAVLFSGLHAPQREIEKLLLFPELADQINDVSSLQVDSGSDHSVVLQRQTDQWVVQSSSDYPASLGKIRAAVLALAELKVLATKTRNPALYSKLGVAGSDEGGIRSKMVRLNNTEGDVLAELILGNPKHSGQREQVYVRKSDAEHALLVEGSVSVGVLDRDWYERKILDINSSRVHTVTVVKPEKQQLMIGKSAEGEEAFEVLEGKTEVATAVLNKLATFLEDINVDEVQSADSFVFPEDATITTFQMFNGLVVVVNSALQDINPWVNFSFSSLPVESIESESGDAAQVDVIEAVEDADVTEEDGTDAEEDVETAAEEAERLNNVLSAWVYQIPEFKFESLNIDIANPAE